MRIADSECGLCCCLCLTFFERLINSLCLLVLPSMVYFDNVADVEINDGITYQDSAFLTTAY